jgi:plastocyanin
MHRLIALGAGLALAACAATPPSPVAPQAASDPAPGEAEVDAVASAEEPPTHAGPAVIEPAPEAVAETMPAPVLPAEAPAPDGAAEAIPEPEPAEIAVTPVEPAPAAAPVGTASLSGRISLVPVHPVPAGPALLSRTWVAFRPREPVPTQPGEEVRILTRSSEFQPQTMAITVGTTVRFPNLDRILHNVFSLTPGNSFDVGLYGPGAGEAHTFRRAGFVDIYCNVHPNMAAFLWVLDTPYFTQVNADGSFRLDNLPAVGGVLEVWNHRAETVTIPALPPADNLRATLRITRPPVPQHTNKLGEPY